MPPSRFLGLPWSEWGETDRLLVEAAGICRDDLCPCGCGQWVDEAHDESSDGRWEVSAPVCYARNAIEAWQEKHREDADPGQLVGVHLLPEGVTPKDPLEFDPTRAATEFAALQTRLGR